MADLDRDTLDRAARWCAEAGRPTTLPRLRAALGHLSWDQLLAVRALLADPPPARPLGPLALVDLAKGVPPAEAVAREELREADAGEAAEEAEAAETEAAERRIPEPAVPATLRSGASRGRKAAASAARRAPKLRRAADRAAAPPPAPPRLPLLDELLRPEGRATLEQLFRRHGGRRPPLLAALVAGWRRADGIALGSTDLDRLLEHHDLTRVYRRRERDELLHAVRAAGGVLAAAATALGHELATLQAAIDRLEVRVEVESVRQARGRQLLARATLADLARLLVEDRERLLDLGLLERIEADVKARLGEHLRALRAAGEPMAMALARSLGLTTDAARELAERLGADLSARGAGVASGAPVAGGPSARPARPQGPRSAGAGPGDRPRGDRPRFDRPPAGRPGSSRPGAGRPGTDRPKSNRQGGDGPGSDRPRGVRAQGDRPRFDRAPSDGPRPPRPGGGSRPARPTGGARSPRPTGAPRPSGPAGGPTRPARPGPRSPRPTHR